MIYYYFMMDWEEENEMFSFLEATQGIGISVALMYYILARERLTLS